MYDEDYILTQQGCSGKIVSENVYNLFISKKTIPYHTEKQTALKSSVIFKIWVKEVEFLSQTVQNVHKFVVKHY